MAMFVSLGSIGLFMTMSWIRKRFEEKFSSSVLTVTFINTLQCVSALTCLVGIIVSAGTGV